MIIITKKDINPFWHSVRDRGYAQISFLISNFAWRQIANGEFSVIEQNRVMLLVNLSSNKFSKST